MVPKKCVSLLIEFIKQQTAKNADGAVVEAWNSLPPTLDSVDATQRAKLRARLAQIPELNAVAFKIF